MLRYSLICIAFCLSSIVHALPAGLATDPDIVIADEYEVQYELDTIPWGEATPLKQVVVTGSQVPIVSMALPQSVLSISRNTISRSHEPSLLPLLSEQVPGLMITQRGFGYGVGNNAAGRMKMRGVGGEPTTGMLVLIDGQPNYMGLMGHPLPDTYASAYAERVEVLSTPASVLYGSNAMGGVINIITRSPLEYDSYGEARIAFGSNNTITTDATVSKREGKISGVLTINANRSDGHRERSGYESQGGALQLGYDISQQWKVKADVNMSRIDVANPGDANALPLYDNEAKVTRGIASLSANHQYSKMSGAVRAYYNWGRHKINDGYFLNQPKPDSMFHTSDYLAGISVFETFQFAEGNSTTVGVDIQEIGGEAWHRYADGSKAERCKETVMDFAGYINMQQAIGNRITLNAGFRADNREGVGTELVPQLGAVVIVGWHSVVKLLGNKGYRNPTIRDKYLFATQNPDLAPERLMSYELSYHSRTHGSKPLHYNFAAYYINGSNIIDVVPTNGRLINQNVGKLKNYGFEAMAHYSPSPQLQLTANYAYLHAKYKTTAAPEHKAFAQASYTRNRMRFATSLQYIGKMHTQIKPTLETMSIALWDASLTFLCNEWVEIFAKADNILGKEYEFIKGYTMPKTTWQCGLKFSI